MWGRPLLACAHVLRSTRAAFASLPDLSGLSLVRSVDRSIERHTSIFVESPIHVLVMPVDSADTLSHDKLSVQLFSRSTAPGDFNVKQTSKRLELVNTASAADHSDVCLLKVPLQLKVNVSATNEACVDVRRLHAEEVAIKTRKGSVHLGDLQAQSITVESEEGSVTGAGRLQAASIDLKTGADKGISCSNILSNEIKVTTHAGSITVESCYSDVSHFTTALGNIRLDHMHRSCLIDIIQNGNLHVTGLDGQLQASLKSGNVFVHASKLTDKSSVFIHEKGRVELRISDLIKQLTTINLIADKIDVDEEVKKLGRYMDDSHPQRFRYPLVEADSASELHVECRNGFIELKRSDFPFMLKVM